MKKLLTLSLWLMTMTAVLTWCGSSGPVVENGDTVRVNYVWTIQDTGEVFDTSIESKAKEAEIFNEARPYEPLEFPVWAGQMIPGFDAGVVGMKEWESKTITLTPEDWYWQYDEEKIQDIPLETFSWSGIIPEPGMELNLWFTRWVVLEVSDTAAKIDLNHFLAGKWLIFEVEMVDIIKPSEAIQAPAPIAPEPIPAAE